MSEQVIRPEGIPSEEAFGSFTVSMRGYFSTQHLWSAEHFIRLTAELEAAHTGEARFSIRHRSVLPLGAVGEAVAFLEAFVNELFQDAADATKADPVPGPRLRLRGCRMTWRGSWRRTGTARTRASVSGHSTSTTRRACSPGARVKIADASPTRTCRA